SLDKTKYYVQKMKPGQRKSLDYDEIDELTSMFRRQLRVVKSPKSSCNFLTSDRLDGCLNEISEKLSKIDPTNPVTKEIRMTIFFGKELFVNVGRKIFGMNDWCNFERGKNGMGTSFQHHSPNIQNNTELLQKRFGFKKSSRDKNNDSNKHSITVYYVVNDKKRKLKLHW